MKLNTVKLIVNESLKKIVGQKRSLPSVSIPIPLEEIATTVKKMKPNIDNNSLIHSSGIVLFLSKATNVMNIIQRVKSI